MSLILADSVSEAIPLLQKVLRIERRVDLYVQAEGRGYWVEIKRNLKPAETLTRDELREEIRKLTRPQVRDISVRAWDFFMYRGYHKHYKSSAF